MKYKQIRVSKNDIKKVFNSDNSFEKEINDANAVCMGEKPFIKFYFVGLQFKGMYCERKRYAEIHYTADIHYLMDVLNFKIKQLVRKHKGNNLYDLYEVY